MINNIKITLGDDTEWEFAQADTFALHPLGFLIVNAKGRAHFFNTEAVAHYSYDMEEKKNELEGFDTTNVVKLQ